MRWTLRRLVQWAEEQFGLRWCRETIRRALHRLGLSWKKAKKLLGKADPRQREEFLEKLKSLARRRSPHRARRMEIRLTKIIMVASLAAYAAIVAINNLIDYDSNYQFVRHVLSMDTVFPNNALRWRAITSPAFWTVGYWIIIAGEAATALAFASGAVALWRARRCAAAAFHRAKRMTVIGAGIGFLVWFLGFMVIGGEWFSMWQSSTWNGQQAALRIYVTLLGVLIFINQPDEELKGQS